ncbi:hypothetical protein [Stackebrandtia nassauensis]|nr:hypothetical protein [Stackebrandtia nassauensis]
MAPLQRAQAWSELVDWVAWLHDRYELSVANRLPACWPGHPGLIEELWALRLWRRDIYSTQDTDSGSAPNGLGQPARYWHTELHNVITRAEQFYASKCRSGHKPAATLTDHPETVREWHAADPLIGVATMPAGADPANDIDGGATVAETIMTAAFLRGTAKPVNNTAGQFAWYRGSWWAPDGPNWVSVPDSTMTAWLDNHAAHVRTTEAAVVGTPTKSTRTP